MIELNSELLPAAENRRVNISEAAMMAAGVHTTWGLQGLRFLARIGLAAPEDRVDDFDPLVVFQAGMFGSQQLLANVRNSTAWCEDRNSDGINSGVVAVVGSRYLEALAKLRHTQSLADFTAQAEHLPPASDVYLRGGEKFEGDNLAVTFTDNRLITVSAFGDVTLRIEHARAA